MIIYKPSDRICIELGDLLVTLAPLTFEQKSDVFEAQMKGGSEVTNQTETSRKAIAYSIKDLKGAKQWDGQDFKLEFEDSGKLTPDTVDALMSLPDVGSLVNAVGSIIRGDDLKKSGIKLANTKGGGQKNV